MSNPRGRGGEGEEEGDAEEEEEIEKEGQRGVRAVARISRIGLMLYLHHVNMIVCGNSSPPIIVRRIIDRRHNGRYQIH